MFYCYLSYWVIQSRGFSLRPWWNNYALKFRIIRTEQSDTFHSDSIKHTLNILLSDDSLLFSGVLTRCWALETLLVVKLYISVTGQTVGMPSLAALTQRRKFVLIHLDKGIVTVLLTNCSCTDVKSHSVGSILKLNILLQVQKLKW